MNYPGSPKSAPARTSPRSRSSPLEPLRHPQYAACWVTGILAHGAAWMQNLTVPFLVYEMTGSAAWLGAAAVAGQAPALIGNPLGGVLADRYSRRGLLLATLGVKFGVALGLYAVGVMRPGRFNVRPDVRPDAELRVSGPYRWVRHPMYTSVLLTALALVWGDFSFVRLGVWALLALDLILKVRYEEHLLSEQFEAYAAYRRRTKRLIPWVY